jgi:hypothetical protein
LSATGGAKFGSNCSISSSGVITAKNINITGGTFSISSGSTSCSISSSGYLSASGASVEGDIDATGGQIGGWTITSSSLYSGSTYLYSNGTIKGATISGGTISADTEINAETFTVKGSNGGTFGAV